MVDKTMCRELKFTTYVKKIYKKVRVLFEMVVSCCSNDAIWIDEKKNQFRAVLQTENTKCSMYLFPW